jgi:hypothetical protein
LKRAARSALLMPLVVKNRTIGLIECCWRNRRACSQRSDRPGARDQQQAALAIENALLFEELRARAGAGTRLRRLQAADRAAATWCPTWPTIWARR